MVSFSRCLLAVTAVLLAFSSANAQGTAGTFGGACVNGVTCNTGLQCLLGFCTIALPAGSEGGSCLVGNTCNTGLTCFLGFCAKTSTGGGSSSATAGTLGGVCLAGNTCNTGLSCLLGICTIGLPAGSEGGACLAGNICNTGLSCFVGICAQTSVNPAGSLGGACVNGVTCNTGLSCLLGICTIATGLPTAGAFGGACLAGNTCNTGLSCLAGVCTIGAITTPTCKSNADCGIGQQCDKTAGTCSSWVVPALDCGNACPSGTNCRLGVCLPALPVSNCVNSCNTNNGETCIAGSCVQANAPYCGGCSGNCFATQNGPTCVPSGPACNKTSDCMANNICSFGTCTTIPAGFANLISNSSVFASTVRDNILAELANIGASLNSFTSVSASADVKGQIAGGSFSASAGALIQLDSSITTLQNLAFAGANAAARIEAGATQTLQSLQATAAQAQLLVGVGAKAAAGSVTVAAGASLSISMGAAAAVSGAAASIAQFAALTLNGPLTVVGDMNSMFTFPANGSAVLVSNGASVKVSGGVSLTGNAGNAPISIAANGNVRATAQVSAAQFFETAANVLGAAANFTISGVAAFSGRVVEPALTIGSAATVSFAAREGSAAALIAGDVSFDTTSTLAASKLVINGTAAAGANLFFKVIRNCPLTATITYNVQGSASVAVSNGFVLFNYAASTYANVNTFRCGIQVCGTDGCLQIINPYATAGRRLLATGNQASFSPTSASVSAGSTVAVQAASQIKIASTIFALLVAFVVALMYKL